MSILGGRTLQRIGRRALGCAAIVAQLVMLIAPLIDVQQDQATHTIATAAYAGAAAVLHRAPAQSPVPHNATTCPACIAQSLHAEVVAAVRIPTLVVAERAPIEAAVAAIPLVDPPATHQSRAPPVTG